jgi:hypothetical protein
MPAASLRSAAGEARCTMQTLCIEEKKQSKSREMLVFGSFGTQLIVVIRV